MGRAYRRTLEVEVLEDRCTPSTVITPLTPARLGASEFSNFSPSQFSNTQLLPNDTPASQAALLAGPMGALTLAPLFNFGSAADQDLAGFPMPSAASMLVVRGLPNSTSGSSFSTGIGASGFSIDGMEGLEPGGGADLGLGVNSLGELAAAGLLLSSSGGVPSTVPFPLPTYYEALPLYEAAAGVPSYVEFESLSPFVANGMGRASYEGANGEAMYARPVKPPMPTTAPVSMPYLILDWSLGGETS